jgi:hypothetical protein
MAAKAAQQVEANEKGLTTARATVAGGRAP